jgi:hypothetical protein
LNGADLALNPCVWNSVYDHSADEEAIRQLTSKFSVFSDDFGGFIRRLRKTPASLDLAPYFEIVAPRLEVLSEHSTPLQEVHLPSPLFMEMPPLYTNVHIHERYPIVKAICYFLCVPSIYRILEPHLRDMDLFRIYHLEVNAQ